MMAAARVGRHVGGRAPGCARRSLRRRDLFRINHFGMLMERMRSPSIYLEEPLRDLTHAVVPEGTFANLPGRLLVNTVDIERGMQVIWGLPGLQNVSVRDAVYASCALPGYFPPGRVGDRLCVDGGVVDNLPVADRGGRRGSGHRRGRRQHRPAAHPERVVARLREHLPARRGDDDARAAAVSAHALERPADGARASARRRGLAELLEHRQHDRRGTPRGAQGAGRHRRVLRPARRRLPAATASRSRSNREKCIGCGLCVVARAGRRWRSTARARRTRSRTRRTGRRPTESSCASARRARSPRERSSGSSRLSRAEEGERGAA